MSRYYRLCIRLYNITGFSIHVLSNPPSHLTGASFVKYSKIVEELMSHLTILIKVITNHNSKMLMNTLIMLNLNIKQVLQRVVVTRVFTLYQLVYLIIYNLPNMIHKFNAKLILIPDLFDMFIQDEIDIKEAKLLIKEIVDAILILSRKNNVLFITSLLLNKLLSISDLYYKTLLPLFNKSIEIIQNKSSERIIVKINESKYVTNCVTINRKYFISKSDLLIVSNK